MAKVVEPPVLISKVLTFVLATSIVVVGVMIFTLLKMIPLERPEVFFLRTPTRSTNVTIIPMNPDSTNKITLDVYKRGFIREYIIARNTLNWGTDAQITRDNWTNIVKNWSDSRVYSDFANTSLYKDYVFRKAMPAVSCSVNFFPDTKTERSIVAMGKDVYDVKFTWVCKNENSGGQTTQKNYKIQIRIQSDLKKEVSGLFDNLEKLRNNPLGIQVVGYTVKEGKTDPLNSDIESW